MLKQDEDRKSGVYYSVNEHFEGKPDAERALLYSFYLNENHSPHAITT